MEPRRWERCPQGSPSGALLRPAAATWGVPSPISMVAPAVTDSAGPRPVPASRPVSDGCLGKGGGPQWRGSRWRHGNQAQIDVLAAVAASPGWACRALWSSTLRSGAPQGGDGRLQGGGIRQSCWWCPWSAWRRCCPTGSASGSGSGEGERASRSESDGSTGNVEAGIRARRRDVGCD